MGTLNITDIKKEKAEQLQGCDISLKKDGTLMYYMDGKLLSPRCERSERFKHLRDILFNSNFPNCVGEVFIDEKGSCVFDVSRKENWNKAKFYVFDLLGDKRSYSERIKIVKEKVAELNNPFIVPMKFFSNFQEGWEFVKENQSEGLVLRNDYSWYKCKILQEAKVEIESHEAGKDKGTFILIDGNRVSGTSIDYVNKFYELKAKGQKPIAEIEYPFKTKDGHFFQPRLRRVDTTFIIEGIK